VGIPNTFFGEEFLMKTGSGYPEYFFVFL